MKSIVQIASLSALAATLCAAAAPVAVTIRAGAPGREIPSDFAGLSFEMQTLLPQSGGHYFSDANRALIETFRNLGVHSLRVGGNTADNPKIPFPGEADAASLFAFARSAAVPVIFTFRLRSGGPSDAVPLARYLMDHDRSSLVCFAIGNEPNVYAKTYANYRTELNRYISTLDASGAAGAKFCGPSTTPGKTDWARQFAGDFGPSGRIRYVTQHAYPGGNSRKVTDPAAARALMLSPSWVESYQQFHDSFVPAAVAAGLPYRIEETNSFYNGGARDVSNTFAAALWGLDYMNWWAAHGAAGLNFHTGEQVAAGDESTPCYYAVFLTSGGGYAIQPLGYAMKAFALAGPGRVLPMRITASATKPNLTAYGVLAPGGELYVTVIDKESGADARDAAVTFDPGRGYAHAAAIRLEAPDANLAARAGVTLGGAPLGENGAWSGNWTPLTGGRFEIRVPASSAAIVRFTK